MFLEDTMNPIEAILAAFNVANVPLATAAVTAVPNDVAAVDAALVPHITDVALRAACAARIVNQRALAVVPVVQPVAQPLVGQALLPVQVPQAPPLNWGVQQPVVQPQPIVQPSRALAIWTLVLSAVALASVIVFMLWWGHVGTTNNSVANITANAVTAVNTNTDAEAQATRMALATAETTLKGAITASETAVKTAITTDGQATRMALATAETTLKGAITASETAVKTAITTDGQATRRSIWASRKATLDAVDKMALELQKKHVITVKVEK
jgi:hypothetical protein